MWFNQQQHPFVQRPAGPSLSPRCAVWVRGALAAGTAGSEHGPPTARRAARAGTGIHRCPPSFFLFSLTVSRGLDRPDSATRPQSVAFRCGQEAGSGPYRCRPKDCRHGLHPTRVGGAAVSLPRCLVASLPRCFAAVSFAVSVRIQCGGC